MRRGLLWGGVAVFLALVGMVETFAGRQIVDGLPSLGLLLPFFSALGAGFQAARLASARRPALALSLAVLAGTATGAALAALVVFGTLVNLRSVFVNASPALRLLLTFGQGPVGAYLPVVASAAAGGLGGLGALLRAGVRRPVAAGLVGVLTGGLFQEMFQAMLPDVVGGVIFTLDALGQAGAVLVFAIVAGASWLWASGLQGGPIGRLPGARSKPLRVATLLAGTAMLLVLPVVAGPFLSHVLVLVGLYVLMGLGLNLEVGFAGLLDLGFVAFFAIGAYTVGLLTSAGGLAIADLSFWVAVPIAVVISLAAGVILGVPVLRIRGDYLAIATLGFGEIIRLLVLSDFLRPWLGGSQGVLGIPKPLFFGLELAGPEQLFYLTLAASALVAFVAARLRDSRLGRAWMALREDEDVAEAMGINLVNIKLLAYGLGAAFAGVSGAIFAVMVGSVFPHSFQLLISINVLALIIVGGMASTPGVVVGALFLVGLPELLREFADFRFLVYGAALVVMMQLRPEGLWPAPAIRRELHAPEELEPVAPGG